MVIFPTVVYPALSTYCIYNTEFMALAVGTMNLPWLSGNSCCASGCRLGSQHRCFSTANRDDSFYEEILMYATILRFRKPDTGLQLGYMAKMIR